MWGLVVHKLLSFYGELHRTAVDHPVLFAAYIVPFMGAVLLSIGLVCRGKARAAFWCLVGAILIDCVFSWGDDTFTHVYRIAALTDQIRNNAVSAFLTNPNTGETLPTFVYYSEVPYLLPTLLNLLGLPALCGFKLVICLHFVLMAYGVQRLVETAIPPAPSKREAAVGYLVAFLFVSANYVYCLWFTRGSLAELWVYSLMPWVVLAVCTANPRALTLCLFLQIVGHPIVMLQTLVAEVPAAYTMSGLTIVALIRKGFVPMTVALVLALPFWLPQALWQGAIMGPAALPSDFYDSFHTLADLLAVRNERTVGVWLPLGMLALILITKGRLSRHVWASIAVACLVTALQTTYLFDLTKHIPTLSLSLFVWRLALPAAFLLFAALLVGWRGKAQKAYWTLVPLSILSIACMAFVMLEIMPQFVRPLTRGWQDDRVALADYDHGDTIWGVREYFPNYAGLPKNCDTADARRVTYSELVSGIKADAGLLLVRRGPQGLVDYAANGVPIEPAACNDALVLGPLPDGTLVTVSEAKTNRLNYLRTIGFFAALAAIWWFRAWPARLQPKRA